MKSINTELYARFVTSYILFKIAFRENLFIEKVVVNDDLMPNDLALVVAGAHSRLATSIYRVNGALGRNRPPISIDIIYCMNVKQVDEVCNISKTILVEKQKNPVNLQPLKHAKKLNIGVPLGSKYNLNKIFNTIAALRCSSDLKYILRPHPETNVSFIRLEFDELINKLNVNTKLEINTGSFENFVSNVDLVLCGNSSVGKDLLDEGIPILYRDNLDTHEYDAHGWLAGGYFFDFCENLEINLEDIIKFYTN